MRARRRGPAPSLAHDRTRTAQAERAPRGPPQGPGALRCAEGTRQAACSASLPPAATDALLCAAPAPRQHGFLRAEDAEAVGRRVAARGAQRAGRRRPGRAPAGTRALRAPGLEGRRPHQAPREQHPQRRHLWPRYARPCAFVSRVLPRAARCPRALEMCVPRRPSTCSRCVSSRPPWKVTTKPLCAQLPCKSVRPRCSSKLGGASCDKCRACRECDEGR